MWFVVFLVVFHQKQITGKLEIKLQKNKFYFFKYVLTDVLKYKKAEGKREKSLYTRNYTLVF